MQLIIGKKTIPLAANALIEAMKGFEDPEAILYVGYPLMATADDRWELDAMLTSAKYGVVAFDFASGGTSVDPSFWADRQEYQDNMFSAIQSQLMGHANLVRRRKLMVPVEIVTLVPPGAPVPAKSELHFANAGNLLKVLEQVGGHMEPEFLRALNAAFQRVSTIKPAKGRASVTRLDSRGAIMKEIEKEIANLDQWQMGAAIEAPEGPQRIRGLAGSGKTVVLALKAAYLHGAHPDWTIAVTFHTRSLYEQFKDLVRRFSYAHMSDEPDWNKLRVLHAWGSQREPGVYSEMAMHFGVSPKDFSSAKSLYGQANAFKGICDELLEVAKKQERPSLFDAVLVDEAQDLPDSFFKLLYRVVPDPKQIIWAYDELQNLGNYSMKPPRELFGTDQKGEPFIDTLHNVSGQPRQDIILPTCYRNTPWALVTAHALGFGVYRKGGLVQFFDERGLWSDIGYEEVSGTFAPGSRVTLKRKADSVPEFFTKYLANVSDAIQCHVFQDESRQAQWVAEQIEKNVTEDELELSDILVIFPDPLHVQSDAALLIKELRKRGISSHIAGVTTSLNRLFYDDSVAISGIYRAKGNEAPMVYVVNSEYCHQAPELIRKRNTLFTAITRSRAWVRICGCGPEMEDLKKEFDKVVANRFQLAIDVPTDDQLETMRKINRDITPEEREKINSLESLLTAVERGEIPAGALSKKLRKRLEKMFAEKPEDDEE